ncbi:hypothetical protein Val02_52150 [Virgisporangium aliadipatigenens]|uniref:VWFA domain-containing protein n=1 Tax=Virgisporangium aliadipatigenens TaxID=741659 RepID=A0A8J3YMM5_9ACTN|nr:VWA domain-containing protein [Virgisporangium aliadipatigenens]GIJ48329.1 hypothetical protein Val02_52150 [Virgisporangium aliadipatigenens]
MFRSPSTRLWSGICAAAIAAVIGFGPPASAAPSLEDVYRQLGIDRIGAEYVVVVDTSASMRAGDLYESVRGSLREFFAALAPDDRVSLIAMADRATPLWEGAVGRAPGEIVSRLPATPDGAFTDIGAGIDAAVTSLEKRSTAQVAGVVLLTDGRHDPAAGSPFPLTEGFAWQELTARAAKLPQRISSFAVQLRGADGAALLGKVFPSTQVLDPSDVDRLTTRLGAPKAAVLADKARSLLAADLAATVSVEWPDEVRSLGEHTARLSVRVRSSATRLPLELSAIRVSSSAPGVRVRAPEGTVEVPPGGTAEVPLDIEWDAGALSWKPWHVEKRAIPLRLGATVSTPWHEPLRRDLALTPAPTLTGAEVAGTGSAQRGSGQFWLLAIAVLAVCIIAARRWRWIRLHPVPGGTLVATPAGADRSGGSVPLQRRRMPISAAKLGISGSGAVAGRRAGARSEPYLEISYSPDGTPQRLDTRTCPPDGSVSFDDVRFEWRS